MQNEVNDVKDSTLDETLTEQAKAATPRLVEIHDTTEAEAKDFEYPTDLDALDVAVRRSEKIVSFAHPTQDGAKINFLVRALTPGEAAAVSGTLFSNDALQEVMLEVLADKGANLDEEELQRRVVSKLAAQKEHELLTLDTDEKMLRTLQYGIVKPDGVTVERMRQWNPEVIQILYHAITEELTAQDAVWTFPEVGEESDG